MVGVVAMSLKTSCVPERQRQKPFSYKILTYYLMPAGSATQSRVT
jgi:hypothetical protein